MLGTCTLYLLSPLVVQSTSLSLDHHYLTQVTTTIQFSLTTCNSIRQPTNKHLISQSIIHRSSFTRKSPWQQTHDSIFTAPPVSKPHINLQFQPSSSSLDNQAAATSIHHHGFPTGSPLHFCRFLKPHHQSKLLLHNQSTMPLTGATSNSPTLIPPQFTSQIAQSTISYHSAAVVALQPTNS
ncbi:hypothetical protein M0R45_009562 [Rubus argutus]|uniref:Uncharacterized protein n=1 Tax=Rubus argutus TaxID=59490 RepID=A0AAW1Y673_RUBAR